MLCIQKKMERLSGLRGVNVSSYSKGHPYNPFTGEKYPPSLLHFKPFGSLNEDICIDTIRKGGFNAIRLLLLLESVYPSESIDNFNAVYLDEYVAFMEKVRRIIPGVFIIVDFHQDLYSRRLGGCGMPNFLLPKALRSVTTRISGTGASWGIKQVTDRQQYKTWKYFLENEEGSMDIYIECITRVIRYLVTKHKCCIDAIDILNEPGLPETYHGHILLSLDMSLRCNQLSSLYTKAVIKLTNVLMEQPVFFLLEPFNYDVSYILLKRIGLDKCVDVIMDAYRQQPRSPGLPSALDLCQRLVFAPHLYQPLNYFGPSVDRILSYHLETLSASGFSNILIGELGDVTYGKKHGVTLLAEQLRGVSKLGIPWFIWEYAPTYARSFSESSVNYKQTNNLEHWPWNGEYCSIVHHDLEYGKLYDDAIRNNILDDSRTFITDVSCCKNDMEENKLVRNRNLRLHRQTNHGILLMNHIPVRGLIGVEYERISYLTIPYNDGYLIQCVVLEFFGVREFEKFRQKHLASSVTESNILAMANPPGLRKVYYEFFIHGDTVLFFN